MKRDAKKPQAASRAERLLAQFHEESHVATQRVDWQMFRDLIPYARGHFRLYSIALALMPIGAIGAVLQPLLLQRAFNATGAGFDASALGSVMLLYALVIAVRFGASFAETYAMQLAGQRTMANLRRAVFAHIQKLSIAHFDRTPVGRIVTRVTNDIDSMGELFASGAVTALGDLLLLIGIVVSMLVLDWQLSLFAFSIVPPLVIVVEFFRRRLRNAQRAIRARTAQLNAFLNEQVQGIHVVQAFSRERECGEAYGEINGEYREANRESIRTDAMMYASVEAISTVCVALVLFHAAERLGMFETAAQAEHYKGTFIAFYAYIQQFFVPVRDLSTKYTMIQSAFASAERVFGLLSVEDFDAPSSAQPSSPAIDRAQVAFRGVSFRYKESGPLVLDDVSLQIAAGETVAIVGATGAGKTTVTALVQRFYDPESGVVSVAGRDVRSYTREELRSRFAVVQQDVFLFAGDLLSNIAFGDMEPSRERAAEALARVSAAHLFADRSTCTWPSAAKT